MDSNSELSESHPIQSLMTPGEMYLPQEEYFGYVKDYAEDENIIWRKVYDRLTCKVFVKKNNLSSFNVVKIWSQYDDVSPEILYNVIHDAEYRSTWDSHMIEGFELDCVATNSDVGYYSLKLPIPLSNRDFVTQRCWKDYGIGKDKIIFNHSVNHPKAKEKGGFIRGLSFLTAYIIMPWENGCRFYYLTQSDPKGNIPVYLVNWSTSSLAYKTSENLHKACLKYNEWKLKQSNPNFKPWLAPRTITLNISPTVCPMLKKKSEDVISFMNQSLDSFYSTITDISPKNDHHKNNEKKQYKSESNQLNVDSFNPIKSEYSKKVYSKNQSISSNVFLENYTKKVNDFRQNSNGIIKENSNSSSHTDSFQNDSLSSSSRRKRESIKYFFIFMENDRRQPNSIDRCPNCSKNKFSWRQRFLKDYKTYSSQNNSDDLTNYISLELDEFRTLLNSYVFFTGFSQHARCKLDKTLSPINPNVSSALHYLPWSRAN